ncbi:hypothetical protein LCGC14_3149500, partial [marine sediment metagenome]
SIVTMAVSLVVNWSVPCINTILPLSKIPLSEASVRVIVMPAESTVEVN